ncbi:hypothetical protein PYCCODRAFT_574122 [Trametes coccinea BRFM310]|uniref:Uncharacterized protein n=1 Tax=Trametes coccinea (strain BRFM310) TaxID=1353009 RepID=A0A1Y2ILJ9_TRAC3|nr:hypothetical protein PYCCODRAFT_574122 [Trametes coccinea BRFM310]
MRGSEHTELSRRTVRGARAIKRRASSSRRKKRAERNKYRRRPRTGLSRTSPGETLIRRWRSVLPAHRCSVPPGDEAETLFPLLAPSIHGRSPPTPSTTTSTDARPPFAMFPLSSSQHRHRSALASSTYGTLQTSRSRHGLPDRVHSLQKLTGHISSCCTPRPVIRPGRPDRRAAERS